MAVSKTGGPDSIRRSRGSGIEQIGGQSADLSRHEGPLATPDVLLLALFAGVAATPWLWALAGGGGRPSTTWPGVAWLSLVPGLVLVLVRAASSLSESVRIQVSGRRVSRVVLTAAALTAIGIAACWRQALPDAGAPAAYLMVVVGFGSLVALGDLPALALWLVFTGVAPAVASAQSLGGARAADTLALVVNVLIVAGMTAFAQRLLAAASRVRADHEHVVAQLRRQVGLVELANAEKSRFLGAASHDLRQPMHALGLFVAALERELRDTQHHPKVVSMAQAIDALEASFSAMLDISRLDAGVVQAHLQSFPIRDVYRRLHMQCAGDAEARGLSLRFNAGGKIVTSDPQLLERVLGNLVNNALRYTDVGGVVVVTRTRANRMSLEVWDTGIGISERELPKIFHEFYQIGNRGRDRSKGLGMGLSIVTRLVRLLGHELEVRSVPGRGTLFRVLLPRTDLSDIEGVTVAADTLPFALDDDRTALVVDDEAAVRDSMRELLAGWGYTVLEAATIEDLRHVIRQHDGLIDIVVSDLRLGGDEDGIAAIAAAREAYGAPLPALLVTGDTTPTGVQRIHDSGHPVLFKPVRSRDLFSALRSTR